MRFICLIHLVVQVIWLWQNISLLNCHRLPWNCSNVYCHKAASFIYHWVFAGFNIFCFAFLIGKSANKFVCSRFKWGVTEDLNKVINMLQNRVLHRTRTTNDIKLICLFHASECWNAHLMYIVIFTHPFTFLNALILVDLTKAEHMTYFSSV